LRRHRDLAMVVHRRPMAPAGAEGGPIDERGAEPSRTGSPSWVRWAVAPYIRCDSRRMLAPRTSRLTEPGTEHPERCSVFRTNGLRSRGCLPPEQPGTLPRTRNSSAPPDHRGHRRAAYPWCGCQAGRVAGCSIDGRRHRNSRNNRYIDDGSVASMSFQSDIDDRNLLEHREEQSPERRGGTRRASLDGWRCSGSARCLLGNPACPGWMCPGMDLPAVAGADPGAFRRTTAGVQPACASS
jgi:hypothetical protein